MRAVSLRHRLPPNVFVRLWRRWMAAQANQLLEAARLGSDKVEYLTHGREMSNADLCRVAGRHVDDLLRRHMLALDLDPYEIALSDPALLRHLQRCCSLCESRETGMPTKNAATASANDSQIRDQVLSRLNGELWRPSMLNVTVRDGSVDLWGFVTSDDEKMATRIAVESIPGVKTINDHLTVPPPEVALV